MKVYTKISNVYVHKNDKYVQNNNNVYVQNNNNVFVYKNSDVYVHKNDNASKYVLSNLGLKSMQGAGTAACNMLRHGGVYFFMQKDTYSSVHGLSAIKYWPAKKLIEIV